MAFAALPIYFTDEDVTSSQSLRRASSLPEPRFTVEPVAEYRERREPCAVLEI